MKSVSSLDCIIEISEKINIQNPSDGIKINCSNIESSPTIDIEIKKSKINNRIHLTCNEKQDIKATINLQIHNNATLEFIDEANYEGATEIQMNTIMRPNAVFELYRFNKFNVSTKNSFVHNCDLQSNCIFRDFNFSNGSKEMSNITKISLNEKNSKYIGSGVVIADSTNCKNQLDISHMSQSAISDCSFKTVSRGKSNVTFKGKVFVNDDCSDTVSSQISKGLVMSDESKINLTPILEINNDDVVCSHGAASGKPDDSVLFYLASRGIEKNDAEKLYMQGFLSEFLNKIENVQMQSKARDYINQNC